MRTFLILFFLFHSVNLYSLEESLSPSKNFEDSKYIPTFETFTKGYDKTGLYVLLIGGGLASLVQPDDLQIQTDIKNGNSISNGVLKYGDFFGSALPGLAIAATQYQHDYKYGKAHLNAIALTGVSTYILKRAFNKTRPSGGRHSMPSGHTSTAFATATSLAYAYGYKWGIPAFTIATLVAYERMVSDSHWPSDVIAGATLGFFWGRFTYKYELEVQPLISSNASGVSVKYRF